LVTLTGTVINVTYYFQLMPTVKFTYALQRFFPGIKDMETQGSTIHEILSKVEARYPKIQSYLLDEQGSLRRHVNIFIDGKLITDRTGLSDTFSAGSEIHIFQALSGG
jgi:sulfur-carrier protein